MTTIYDVARKAEVSIASVSLVFKDPETRRVGAEKRRKILQIAEAIGYTPSAIAKALSEGSTRIVGLVVPFNEPIFKNPFIADVLTGIQSSVMEYGYHLMVYTHKASTGRLTMSELQQSRLVDGVIAVNTRMCSADDMDATIGELRATNTKFVMVNGYYGNENINYVGVDDEAIARTAVDYLASKGHTRIALITGSSRSPISKRRLTGFRRGMKQHHSATEPLMHIHCNYDDALVLKTLKAWMGQKKPPTAVFCADDHVAAFAYQAARVLDLPVPDKLAILGAGNSSLAAIQQPKLTTVAIPAIEIGQQAARLLIDGFTDANSPRRIILRSEILPGESA